MFFEGVFEGSEDSFKAVDFLEFGVEFILVIAEDVGTHGAFFAGNFNGFDIEGMEFGQVHGWGSSWVESEMEVEPSA